MPTNTYPPRVPRTEYLSSHRAVLKHMAQAYLNFTQRFGEVFVMRLVNRDVIVTTSPDHARHVLVKNHRKYIKDKPTKIVGDIIGNGILTSDGEFWLQQRRLIQPAFHKKQLENLSRVMVKETELYLDRLAQMQGRSVDVLQQMIDLTLNVVSRSLFSTGIDERGLEVVQTSVDSMMELAMARIRNPFQVLAYRLSGKTKLFEQHQKNLEELIFSIIDTRKAEGVGDVDLLDMLLSSKDADTGEELDRNQLRAELATLFLAGHDTSANSLTWTLMFLAKNPGVVERLKAEIDEVLGKEPISFAHLPKLTYLKQVIDESLRLHPPAWAVGREAIEPDEMEGIDIQPGQQVTVFIYGLHRNPRYWNDPEEFDPERFSPEEVKKRPANAYMPFGGGPRLCIGFQFAIYEMQIFLAELIRRFSFEQTDNAVIASEAAITFRPKTPLHMRFNERT